MTGTAKKRQCGVAMLEFTIVLPVMLLMILGVSEIGRALVRYNTLTKAVQDGVRHAAAYALLGSTGIVNIDAQLINEVRNIVVYGNPVGAGSPILEGLAPAQIELTSVGSGEVRVTASYPYQPLIGPGLPTFGLGATNSIAFNMQAAVTMRAL